MVFILIPLMTNAVDHISMSIFAFHMLSLLNYLFISFTGFFLGSFFSDYSVLYPELVDVPSASIYFKIDP